jgi:hypothetical protein
MTKFHAVVMLGAFATLAACHAEQPRKSERAQQQPARAEAPAGWQYEEYHDQMRGTRSWSATLQSLNAPELGFPYEGGSPVTIRLSRTEGDGGDYAPEVMLERGQFDCSQYGSSQSCLITVKADDQKPYDLRGVEVDCGGANCMRLIDQGAIDAMDDKGVYTNVIDLFRRSKRITIELPLYDYGSYQYQFDTRNLDWPKRR